MGHHVASTMAYYVGKKEPHCFLLLLLLLLLCYAGRQASLESEKEGTKKQREERKRPHSTSGSRQKWQDYPSYFYVYSSSRIFALGRGANVFIDIETSVLKNARVHPTCSIADEKKTPSKLAICKTFLLQEKKKQNKTKQKARILLLLPEIWRMGVEGRPG